MRKALLTALFATSAVASIATFALLYSNYSCTKAKQLPPPSTMPPTPSAAPASANAIGASPLVFQRLYVWQSNAWQLEVSGWTADATPQSFLDYLADDVPPTYAVLQVWDGAAWHVSRNW